MDTFKVNGKLTLNYGLRFDYFSAPYWEDTLQARWDPTRPDSTVISAGALSKVSLLYPPSITLVEGEVLPSPDKGNIRPRIGIAYRLNDRTVIRGGYGAFSEQIGTFTMLPSSAPFDIEETYFPNRIVNGQPLFAFPNPFPGDIEAAWIPSQSAIGYPMHSDNGTIHQFNLTVERQFGSLGLRTSYIGSRSRGLNYSISINKPEASLVPFSPDRRPYSEFSSVKWWMDNGKHNYNAFQVELQKKAGDLTFSTHYTLQSSVSNFGNREDPYVYLSGIGSGALQEKDSHLWNREQYDARNKFVFNMSWDIPLGRGKSRLADIPGVMDAIIGGWKLTWVTYLKDGQYFSPSFSGWDPSHTGTFAGLPDRIADGNLPVDQPQSSVGRGAVPCWQDRRVAVAPVTLTHSNVSEIDEVNRHLAFEAVDITALLYGIPLDPFSHPGAVEEQTVGGTVQKQLRLVIIQV